MAGIIKIEAEEQAAGSEPRPWHEAADERSDLDDLTVLTDTTEHRLGGERQERAPDEERADDALALGTVHTGGRQTLDEVVAGLPLTAAIVSAEPPATEGTGAAGPRAGLDRAAVGQAPADAVSDAETGRLEADRIAPLAPGTGAAPAPVVTGAAAPEPEAPSHGVPAREPGTPPAADRSGAEPTGPIEFAAAEVAGEAAPRAEAEPIHEPEAEPENRAPVAGEDRFAGLEDNAIHFTAADLLDNDVDLDGDMLTVVSITPPAEGTLIDHGDGTFSFIPNANWSGDTTFTYTVSDGRGATATGTAVLDVTGVADAPDLQVSLGAGVGGDSGATIHPLDITASLTDLDGSETLGDITVSGVPAGVTFSAGTGLGDGTWTLAPADLEGLTMRVDRSVGDDFPLQVSVSSVEAGGDMATANASIDVTIPEGVTIQGGSSADILYGGGGDDFLRGLGGADTLYGGGGDDFLRGLGGADTLYGGGGDDRLVGGTDDDVLHGEDGHDTLIGEGGEDTLYGGAGDDHLDGGANDDFLDGGAGDDTLIGGGGGDTFIAGAGNDQADGGAGADLFVFGPGAGTDHFDGGSDRWTDTIQLESVGGGPGEGGGWTLEVEGDTPYTMDDHAIVFDEPASGAIHLDDDSVLTFEEVERIIW